MRLLLLSLLVACSSNLDGPPGQEAPTDPALQACVDAPVDANAALGALGGAEVLLASLAPGEVTANRDDGGTISFSITAQVSGEPTAQVLFEGYDDGDPRIVADNLGCVAWVSLPITVTVQGDGWTFVDDGYARGADPAALNARSIQSTLAGPEARLDATSRAAMALPEHTTGYVQLGAYGDLTAASTTQGWMAFGTDAVTDGLDTGGGGRTDLRWRW